MTDPDMRGAGPYQFTPHKLTPGESFTLDFRNMEKGRYKEDLPFDVTRFVSSVGEPVDATINGVYETRIPGNVNLTWSKVGVTNITVVNAGVNDIPEGDFIVETQTEPYGADEAARRREAGSWAENALNDLIPGGLPNGL